MGTAALQFFCHLYVVLEGVFIVLGIEDIAGVADGRLKDLILLQDFVHGDGHALDPVEGVKHTEDINAALGGGFDEFADQVVGIVGVADGVGTAEQHLQEQVGGFFADDVQTLPGRLMQEAVTDVESRAAPALEGEGIRQDL